MTSLYRLPRGQSSSTRAVESLQGSAAAHVEMLDVVFQSARQPIVARRAFLRASRIPFRIGGGPNRLWPAAAVTSLYHVQQPLHFPLQRGDFSLLSTGLCCRVTGPGHHHLPQVVRHAVGPVLPADTLDFLVFILGNPSADDPIAFDETQLSEGQVPRPPPNVST